MDYIKRPISHAIADSPQKVVILEGARAVGKTSLAREELAPLEFKYHTLADATTYELASADPAFWLRSIGHPSIIDEAQRVKGLSMAVKEYIDKQMESGVYFILTGSASIGKAGLDGQDPLTRRSQRFTLDPLTQREIIGNEKNIVDELWEGQINNEFETTASETQLETILRTGGFPYYVDASLSGKLRDISSQVRSDITNVLGDTLLPEERFDRAIAQSILNRLLSLPGDILNMSSIGKAIGCDNRTVERYVSIFANRFLVRHLSNLKSLPQKQNFTRAKIHPIDVSFSIATLEEGGINPFGDRAYLGKILESYVVSQIAPATQWATHKADCYYWRQSGRSPKEVDLVLLYNNELIGIEVKASTSVSQSDFAGLYALSEDSRFFRGYVVYLGNTTIHFSEKMCAIPLSALWESSAFQSETLERKLPPMDAIKKEAPTGASQPSKMMADANIFLSYTHADNEHLDNAMVDFAQAIVDEYEFQFGATLQLFIDRESIRWGDNWQREIERNIEDTHFFMPCVTPRYLLSEACRKEFLQFLAKADSSGNCKILSLMWQPPTSTDDNQVLAAIKRYQHEDVSILRDLVPQDREYKKLVRHLAEELHRIIADNALALGAVQYAVEPINTDGVEVDSLEDFAEKLDKISVEMPEFNKASREVVDSFNELSQIFDDTPFPTTSAGGYSKWGISLAAKASPSVDRLDASITRINEIWETCYSLMRGYVSLGRDLGMDTSDILPTLYSLRNSTIGSFDIAQAEQLVQALPKLSSRLKPLSQCMRRLLDTFRDIAAMTELLIEDVESSMLINVEGGTETLEAAIGTERD